MEPPVLGSAFGNCNLTDPVLFFFFFLPKVTRTRDKQTNKNRAVLDLIERDGRMSETVGPPVTCEAGGARLYCPEPTASLGTLLIGYDPPDHTS